VGLLDLSEEVRTHLVPQSSRPAVDEHDDLVLGEAVGVADVLAEDVRDPLDLEEVVARAERSYLVASAVLGLL
jgi:hypothetical protein